MVTVDQRQLRKAPRVVQHHLRKLSRSRLETAPDMGDAIRRDRWSTRFRRLPNLFRSPLPEDHRMLYTILSHPGMETEVRIVWIGNHKQYDRLFGYNTS